MDPIGMNGFNGFSGFSFMFTIVPFMVFLVFAFVIGFVIYSMSQRVKQNNRNNRSPVLTVEATVTSKRTDISNYHHRNADSTLDHYNSSTWYYVTFQVESGDRMELGLTGTEFGLLVEGDTGRLTFQGTRYLGFVRN